MTLGSDNAGAGTPEGSTERAEEAPAAQPIVTELQPEPVIALPQAGPRRPGRLSRILEWFTRRGALREARAAVSAQVARPDRLLSAFSAVALAETCLRGGGRRGPQPSLACDAARRAVLLALSALAPADRAAEESIEPSALFDAAPRDLIEGAASGENVQRLRAEVISLDFRRYVELAEEEQNAMARRLIAFARRLSTSLEQRQHVVDRFARQRLMRLSAVALLLLVSLLLVASDVLVSFRDVAEGKPWRASSTYGNGGCRSPAQVCTESPFFFFHTLDEENPWVEIDLGKPIEISALVVENRSDCCADRAVPLLVEVATKRSRWKTVARIETAFDQWRPSFEPVDARYVRLKATRKTLLHLKRVRVLR